MMILKILIMVVMMVIKMNMVTFSILETSGNTDRHHRHNNGSKGEDIYNDNGRHDFYDYVYFSDVRMESEWSELKSMFTCGLCASDES